MQRAHQNHAEFSFALGALTDVGRVRRHNEDQFAVCPDLSRAQWGLVGSTRPGPAGCLLVVADGLGGYNAGEVASEIAVRSVKRYFASHPVLRIPDEVEARRRLTQAILVAHESIVIHADTHPECQGMGSTIVVAWVVERHLYVAWSGDSRCYLQRPNAPLELLTDDHSLVWQWVQEGKLSPEEADFHPQSNIITQCLGYAQDRPDPGFVTRELQLGDKVLLCSDGLNNSVPYRQLGELLAGAGTPAELCRRLVDCANRNGGRDNTTVVLLEVLADIEQPPVA